MTDIAHAVEVARSHPAKPLVAVDNTFLGPTFQHPLEIGADLAVYSATKFLGDRATSSAASCSRATQGSWRSSGACARCSALLHRTRHGYRFAS